MPDRPLLQIPDGDADEMDREFDKVYPPFIERLSRVHWSPVAVAKRAAELLECGTDQTVLDVGAGVGKFCVVGALATPATFLGVEKRDRLVTIGQQLVQQHRVRRVELIQGDALALDWSRFDGLYLYNPFADSLPNELSIRRTEMKLWEVRPGARVVTYHGFGGEMPSVYRLLARELAGTDQVEVWQRMQEDEVA
jgi:hypothetical protein